MFRLPCDMYSVGSLFLHHLGFVVSDVRAGAKAFSLSLGATWDGLIHSDPLQKVKVAFLATRSGDPQIELIEPSASDSPVTRFLNEKGGGLHHICYEVDDLEPQMAALKSRGAFIVLPPKPAAAFQGRRIVWLLTQEELLVELLENN